MPDELLVLGSSCGIPSQGRFASAYALRVAGKLFLLDCGAPVSSLLYQYDLDPMDVQAIFLSHWHLDHVAGLGLFLAQNHLQKRPNPLSIYGPRGTRGKVRRLLADSFMLADEMSYPLEITKIKSGKTCKQALIQVKFFKTQHLEKPWYKTNFGRKAVAYGMVVDGPGWRLVYSGDLSSPRELSPYISGCDLLIHEMTHPDIEEVAEFVQTAGVPHVIVSHIGPQYDQTPQKIEKIFSARYSGKLTIAQDGTKVRLDKQAKTR